MSYARAILAASCAALALATRPALGQLTLHATVAVGSTDVGAGADGGFVGHLGLRAAPGQRTAWAQLRADATAGRLHGQSVRGATAALELGPPETRTGGVRVFGLAGASVVRTGPGRDAGLMAGVGARARLGRVALSAEQRFQPGFSPLLVGVSF